MCLSIVDATFEPNDRVERGWKIVKIHRGRLYPWCYDNGTPFTTEFQKSAYKGISPEYYLGFHYFIHRFEAEQAAERVQDGGPSEVVEIEARDIRAHGKEFWGEPLYEVHVAREVRLLEGGSDSCD